MKCLNCNREFGTPRDNCPFCGAVMSEQEEKNVQNEIVNENIVEIADSSVVNEEKNNAIDNQTLSNEGDNSNGDLISLTITRKGKIMGFAINFAVFVDGVRLGDLKNGKSLSCQVGRGGHEILIKCVEKDLKQTISVSDSTNSVEVITHAKMGLLAAVAKIDDIIYK